MLTLSEQGVDCFEGTREVFPCSQPLSESGHPPGVRPAFLQFKAHFRSI